MVSSEHVLPTFRVPNYFSFIPLDLRHVSSVIPGSDHRWGHLDLEDLKGLALILVRPFLSQL